MAEQSAAENARPERKYWAYLRLLLYAIALLAGLFYCWLVTRRPPADAHLVVTILFLSLILALSGLEVLALVWSARNQDRCIPLANGLRGVFVGQTVAIPITVIATVVGAIASSSRSPETGFYMVLASPFLSVLVLPLTLPLGAMAGLWIANRARWRLAPVLGAGLGAISGTCLANLYLLTLPGKLFDTLYGSAPSDLIWLFTDLLNLPLPFAYRLFGFLYGLLGGACLIGALWNIKRVSWPSVAVGVVGTASLLLFTASRKREIDLHILTADKLEAAGQGNELLTRANSGDGDATVAYAKAHPYEAAMSPNPGMRDHGIHALSASGDRRVVPMLRKKLDEAETPRDRCMYGSMLARYFEDQGIDTLVAILGDYSIRSEHPLAIATLKDTASAKAVDCAVAGLSWRLEHLDQFDSNDGEFVQFSSTLLEHRPDERALPLLEKFQALRGQRANPALRFLPVLDRSIEACRKLRDRHRGAKAR